jgi:hypothetical protein
MMRTSEIFRENRNLPFMKTDSGEDDLVDIKALKNVLANRDSLLTMPSPFTLSCEAVVLRSSGPLLSRAY